MPPFLKRRVGCGEYDFHAKSENLYHDRRLYVLIRIRHGFRAVILVGGNEWMAIRLCFKGMGNNCNRSW